MFTEFVVALAHPGKDKLLDVIPLHEIMNVQSVDGVSVADLYPDAGRILLEITVTDGNESAFSKWFYESLLSRTNSATEEGEEQRLRRAFRELDVDGSGALSLAEITQFLTNLGYSASEAKAFFETADSDGSGELSFNEFWEYREKEMSSARSRKLLKVTIIKAENVLNTDGTGTKPQGDAKNFWCNPSSLPLLPFLPSSLPHHLPPTHACTHARTRGRAGSA